jgi:hydroxymethylglutaryl-CoA synthase
MFSYGSGCAASMFLIRVAKNKDYLQVIRPTNFKERLESRVKISPEQFDQWMAHREANYGVVPFIPQTSIENLYEGTFYLTHIDEKYRRFYELKTSSPIPSTEIKQLSSGTNFESAKTSALSDEEIHNHTSQAATRLSTVRKHI